MGLSPFKKCCLYSSKSSVVAPNPDPLNFKIVSLLEKDEFLIAEINYPGCTNFEGNKICVFRGVTAHSLKSLSKLDPHFSDGNLSPVARFAPTIEGMRLARRMVGYSDDIKKDNSSISEDWVERHKLHEEILKDVEKAKLNPNALPIKTIDERFDRFSSIFDEVCAEIKSDGIEKYDAFYDKFGSTFAIYEVLRIFDDCQTGEYFRVGGLEMAEALKFLAIALYYEKESLGREHPSLPLIRSGLKKLKPGDVVMG